MKKISLVFLLLCSAFLFGCSGKEDGEMPTVTEQSEQSETDNKNAVSNEKENITEEIIGLSNYFNGIKGCAVIYNPIENTCYFYNEDLAKQETSPYSTFKIISALAGIHNNVIKDETSTMNYNGTQSPTLEWNKNLTLKEAFQTSCIWYFRQVINAVGKMKFKMS